MLTPPDYDPGPAQKVYNGDVAMSRDARAVDRATTWLACHRFARPALIGAVLESGNTYTFTTLIPGYTEYVAFALLLTGCGTVTLDSGESGPNSVVAFDVAGATLADAVWFWADEPKTVAGDGYERALAVADQSTPHEVTFTVDVADGDGDAVRVWQIVIYPLPRESALG